MNLNTSEQFRPEDRDIINLLSMSNDVQPDMSRRKIMRDSWRISEHCTIISVDIRSQWQKIAGVEDMREKELIKQTEKNFAEAETQLVECLRDIEIKLGVLDILTDPRFKKCTNKMDTMDTAIDALRELVIEFFELKLALLKTKNKLASLQKTENKSVLFKDLPNYILKFYEFSSMVCKKKSEWEKAYAVFVGFGDERSSENCDTVAQDLLNLFKKDKNEMLNFN